MSNAEQLASYREHMQVSQAVMAKHMGLPLRTYEDLERSRSQVRDVHLVAARFACLTIATELRRSLDALPEDVRAEWQRGVDMANAAAASAPSGEASPRP